MVKYPYKIDIEYLEKPVTSDEKEVAKLLEKIIISIKNKDLDLLASVFSDSATIAMTGLTGQPVDKTKYIETMRKVIHNVRSICYKNVLIRIYGDSAAVSLVSKIDTKNASNLVTQRYFKCTRINNSWCIAEAIST